ncbi:unnamed protein product, partial [Didymodactylos carnosus]
MTTTTCPRRKDLRRIDRAPENVRNHDSNNDELDPSKGRELYRPELPRENRQTFPYDEPDSSANNYYSQKASLPDIPSLLLNPPELIDMYNINDANHIFMIKPYNYVEENRDIRPVPVNANGFYKDIWDENHVEMPCSQYNSKDDDQTGRWPYISKQLTELKKLCEEKTITIGDIE